MNANARRGPMFTGIISGVGRLKRIIPSGDKRLEFITDYDTSDINIGASIACSGVCLTVTETSRDWFAVDVSKETLSNTTINSWSVGTWVNFERPLKLGDEMGGHFVSGHVDGCGTVLQKKYQGNSVNLSFKVPSRLKSMIANKGSITIDGVSLTINTVSDNIFSVNIIPHTNEKTTLGKLNVDDQVNIEIDMLARYLARILEKDQ